MLVPFFSRGIHKRKQETDKKVCKDMSMEIPMIFQHARNVIFFFTQSRAFVCAFPG